MISFHDNYQSSRAFAPWIAESRMNNRAFPLADLRNNQPPQELVRLIEEAVVEGSSMAQKECYELLKPVVESAVSLFTKKHGLKPLLSQLGQISTQNEPDGHQGVFKEKEIMVHEFLTTIIYGAEEKSVLKTWLQYVQDNRQSSLYITVYHKTGQLVLDYRRKLLRLVRKGKLIETEESLGYLEQSSVDTDSQEDSLLREESMHFLRKTIDEQLNPQDRQIISLILDQGMEVGDIAKTTGLTEARISVRKNRAINKLKERMKEYCEGSF